MSLVIKFHFTSSTLNMFRTLIHPSSGACDFSIASPHWSCVLVSMCVGVSVWKPATRIPPQPSHTETPTHIETRTHDQCGDTIEKSQAPEDGCINVRNMFSVELKWNLITSDIKLVCYSSTMFITLFTRGVYNAARKSHASKLSPVWCGQCTYSKQ